MESNETKQYKGWLISTNFFKRSLAVLGYGIIGQFLIFLPIVILILILGGIFGLD